MEDKKFNTIIKWLNIIKVILIVVLGIVLLYSLCVKFNRQVNKVNDLDKRLIKLETEMREVWKNIDAISEDYTTLWVQLYGEDSWYESPADKEKVHNEIKNMGE